MQTYVVLLRGVNVGGKNRLPMKPLVALLAQNNFQQVSYYIQSGNLVLNSNEDPAAAIKTIIFESFGFAPDVFVLSGSAFLLAVSKNPYQEFEGKFVHFYFCQESIKLNLEKVDRWMSATEKYYVEDNVFYLFAPEGIGRSKLVKNIESCLGQSGTGRNLNTVNKLKALVDNTLSNS